jgi:hypothetical protein
MLSLIACEVLVEMIEMEFWLTQFGVRMQKLCLREDSDTRRVGGRCGRTY